MDLQVYFNCLYSAILKIDDCITGLELSFLGVDIDLGVLLGCACMTAIINAIVSPTKEEYDEL